LRLEKYSVKGKSKKSDNDLASSQELLGDEIDLNFNKNYLGFAFQR